MTCSAPTPKQEAVLEGMRRAGVPSKYLGVEPQPLPTRKPWAYVTGAAGSGKTHLVCGMLRTYVYEHMSCYEATNFNGDVIERYYTPPRAAFITSPEYLAAIKEGFTGEDRARFYRLTPFLVLDDLGQEVPTQWAVSELFELINFRYGEELPTIITSQFRRDVLARKLARNGGEVQALAIVSRLTEVCQGFDLGEVDRRLLA